MYNSYHAFTMAPSQLYAHELGSFSVTWLKTYLSTFVYVSARIRFAWFVANESLRTHTHPGKMVESSQLFIR